MSSFGERAKAKLAKYGRLDLAIADVRKTDRKSVKVALSFVSNLGNPTKSEVTEFFQIHLPEFTPSMETAHRVGEAIVVHASLTPVKRPMTDKSKMTEVVAGLKFLDVEMGSAWEVEKEGDAVVLQQVHHMDVADMVRQRAQRMNRVSAEVQITAMAANVQVGDKVKAWHENYAYEGTVTKLQAPKVTIAVAGKPMVLDVHAIYKVVEKSTASEKENQKMMTDFYSQVYGPKFARDMTKK